MSETEKTKKPATKKAAPKKMVEDKAVIKSPTAPKKVVAKADAEIKTSERSPRATTRVVKKEELDKKPALTARRAAPVVEAPASAIPSDISLSDLKAALKQKDKEKAAVKEQKTAGPREKVIDALGRSYATGKRKNAIARVWIKPGHGRVVVNGREEEIYFKRAVLRMMIHQPFRLAERVGQYDVQCTLSGGGLSGQAGALRHGISRALVAYEPDLHVPLKRAGFLTRDSRTVERKKYGQPKARRRFQFSKR